MIWRCGKAQPHEAIGMIVEAFYPALKAVERGERVDLRIESLLDCEGEVIDGHFTVQVAPPFTITPDPDNPSTVFGDWEPMEVSRAIGFIVDLFYATILKRKKEYIRVEISGPSPLHGEPLDWGFDVEIKPPYH